MCVCTWVGGPGWGWRNWNVIVSNVEGASLARGAGDMSFAAALFTLLGAALLQHFNCPEVASCGDM